MSYYVRKPSINHFIKIYTKDKIYDGPDFLPDNIKETLDNCQSDCQIYTIGEKNAENIRTATELGEIINLCSKEPASPNTISVIMATANKLPIPLFLEEIYLNLKNNNYTEKEKLNLMFLLQEIIRISEKRNPLKLAFILAAIIGPATIKAHNRQLFNDLFMIGRCSEFTPYLACCLKLSGYSASQKELWNIFAHSENIGKLLLSFLLKCNTLEQKEYLLEKKVVWSFFSYNPASVIIEKVGLKEYLSSNSPNSKLLCIIGEFLIIRIEEQIEKALPRSSHKPLQFPFHTYFKSPPLAPIGDCTILFMEHITKQDPSPKLLINMLAIKERIELILEKDPVYIFPLMNTTTAQNIIARCDALIYKKNMHQYILDNLLDENDFIIKEYAQLAMKSHCNIFNVVYKHYKKNKNDVNALRYLEIFFQRKLRGPQREEGTNKLQEFLKDVSEDLNLYLENEHLMVNFCTTLAFLPNQGEDILAAGLNSIFESVRKASAVALAFWDLTNCSPELCKSIRNSYYSSGDKSLKKLLASIERNRKVKKPRRFKQPQHF